MMVKLRCYLRTVLLIAIGLSWVSGADFDWYQDFWIRL